MRRAVRSFGRTVRDFRFRHQRSGFTRAYGFPDRPDRDPCHLLARDGVRAANLHVGTARRLVDSASARRIQDEYADFPIDLIETHVICWLETEYAPPTFTPEQLDELDELTEAWVKDHERQADAATKAPRTRHS